MIEFHADFLAAAERGSSGTLRHLWSSLTEENYTPKVLTILLLHLQLERVLNTLTGEYKLQQHKQPPRHAMEGLAGLGTVVKLLNAPSTAGREGAIARVLQAWDGIVAWMHFLNYFGMSIPMDTTPGADFRLTYYVQAELLLLCMKWDPRLERTMYESTATLDLIIKCWVTAGKRSAVFQRLTDRTLGCPITRLVLHCVSSEESRVALCTRVVCREPVLAGHFVSVLQERFEQIERAARARGIPHALVARAFTQLARCMGGLSDYNPLLRHLRRGNHASGVTLSSCTILQQIRTDKRWEEALEIYNAVLTVLSEHSTAVRWNIIDMSNPHVDFFRGFFSMIADPSFASAPGNVDGAKAFMARLESVTTADIRVSEGLYITLSHRAFGQPWLHCLHESLRATAINLHRGVEERMDVLRGATQLHGDCEPMCREVCDNAECMRERIGSPPVFKSCSGCRHVVYCFSECQEKDWDRRHRTEGPLLSPLYFQRKEEGQWYPSNLREMHVAYIEHVFNRTLAGYPSAKDCPVAARDFMGINVQQIFKRKVLAQWAKPVYLYDTTKPEPKITAYPSKKGSHYPHRSMVNGRVCLEHAAMQPRIDEMLEEAQSVPGMVEWDGGVREEVEVCGEGCEVNRFVEAKFAWRGGVVLLMVKLNLNRLDDEMCRFVAMYSVPRFFPLR